MSRALLLGGGLALVAGGVAYYFLKQQEEDENGASCEEGSEKCVGHDLFHCTNGKWVKIQENAESCMNPCTGNCGAEGWTMCEGDNLCICENGEYRLFQAHSSKCTSGLSHKHCFVDADGFSVCLSIPGHGTDYCWGPKFPFYSSAGCSCVPPKHCYPEQWCDTTYSKLCMNLASNAWFEANLHSGGDDEDISYDYVYTKDCTLNHDLAIGANRFLADLYYKWATPGDAIDIAIAAGIGAQYSWIYNQRHWIWLGGDGVISNQTMSFPRQGVEWIYVVCDRVGFSGRITSVLGTLSSV